MPDDYEDDVYRAARMLADGDEHVEEHIRRQVSRETVLERLFYTQKTRSYLSNLDRRIKWNGIFDLETAATEIAVACIMNDAENYARSHLQYD